MPEGYLEIGRPAWWRLGLLAPGGKKRNKELMIRLAGFNLAQAGRDEILAALDLTPADLEPLKLLADSGGGWRPVKIKRGLDFDLSRLAAPGLVLLKWPRGEVSLSDAGRFLLSLTA